MLNKLASGLLKSFYCSNTTMKTAHQNWSIPFCHETITLQRWMLTRYFKTTWLFLYCYYNHFCYYYCYFYKSPGWKLLEPSQKYNLTTHVAKVIACSKEYSVAIWTAWKSCEETSVVFSALLSHSETSAKGCCFPKNLFPLHLERHPIKASFSPVQSQMPKYNQIFVWSCFNS